MTSVRIFIREGRRPLATRGRRAETPWERAWGLLGRSSMEPDEALWFDDCRSIHTFFMRVRLDLAYVNMRMEVVKLVEDLGPWRVSWCPAGRHVVELPAGSVRRLGLRRGETLDLEVLA